MALIKCKECNNDVSSKAKTCPKCGIRIAPKPIGCFTVIVRIIILIFFGILLLAVLASINSDGEKRQSQPTEGTPPSKQQIYYESPELNKPSLPGAQWMYSKSNDEMAKGTNFYAYVSSSNTVNFAFPYQGKQHGVLTLRTHSRYGKDVIFKIEKGQILCNSYENCTVLIRFDDEKAISFNAISAEDNSTDTVFIENYNRFFEKMQNAKKVRISLNIYQEGSPIFEFDVSGFNKNNYISNK
jgi:hypothetical protein